MAAARQLSARAGWPTWAQHLLATSEHALVVRAEDVCLDDVAAVGQVVVEQVGLKRSTWRRWNLHAEASRQTRGLRFATPTDREAVVGLIAGAG